MQQRRPIDRWAHLCSRRPGCPYRLPRVLLTTVVFAWSASVCRAEELLEPPCTARITTNEVYVRSGPGQQHYPTQMLNQGDRVKVLREDVNGWYAIEPPAGSFSWIAADQIRFMLDKSAITVADQVAVHAGSVLGNNRHEVQLRLPRGTRLEFPPDEQPDPTGPRRGWYKIVPVSGEVRWVHRQYLAPEASSRSERLAEADGMLNRGVNETRESIEESIPRELDRIETELFARFATSGDSPFVDDLKQRAKAIAEDDPSPATRVRARLLVREIDGTSRAEKTAIRAAESLEPSGGDIGRSTSPSAIIVDPPGRPLGPPWISSDPRPRPSIFNALLRPRAANRWADPNFANSFVGLFWPASYRSAPPAGSRAAQFFAPEVEEVPADEYPPAQFDSPGYGPGGGYDNCGSRPVGGKPRGGWFASSGWSGFRVRWPRRPPVYPNGNGWSPSGQYLQSARTYTAGEISTVPGYSPPRINSSPTASLGQDTLPAPIP